MIPLPDIETDYLRIPKQLVDKIHHEPTYIKSGSGKKATRKIFANVNYDSFEKEHIIQLQTKIKQTKIIFPQRIIEEDRLLRYLYSGGFDIEKAYQILTSHYEWISNAENFKILPKTKEYLEKGAVYLAGRDKKFRPIIIINVEMLYGKNFHLDSFMNSLYAVFNLCREVIFVPGKIENWVLLIETNELSMFSFPFNVLEKIISNASLQYSGTMEKIYITNPSTSLNMTWAIIEKFLDDKTKQKINKLKKTEYSKMLEYFTGDQIEMKYGGTMENIKVFWPPIDPLQSIKTQLFHEKENDFISRSNNEIRLNGSRSPLRETKRKIFDDSNLNNDSPILQEEIEEITSFRKTKKEAFTRDLYERFSKKPPNRKYIGENTITENSNGGNMKKEEFQSMYKYLERKSTGTNKRDSAFCGLCFSTRKNNEENEEKAKEANVSVCVIF